MENQNEIRISIPKPCHVNWNKMTPNAKGAFCGKCAKTVVDFTKKTTGEIKDFLLSQSGKKTCGRFKSDQIDQPKSIDLFIPINLLPKKLSFNKAFLFSLFIAFGTSLFSCSTKQGEVVGKIAAIGPSDKTSSGITVSVGDTIYTVAQEMVNGEVAPEKCISMKGDVNVQSLQEEVFEPIDTEVIRKDSLLNDFKKQRK